jgi:hypothetical protein
MDTLIGDTAGKIWNYLTTKDSATSIKIKADLGIPNSLLYLSLGWLARENKIEIAETSNTYKVVLKQI